MKIKIFTDYQKMGFNKSQLDEIQRGLNNNLDVSIYAKKKLSAMQMQVIRNCLEKGFDVTKFADVKLSCEQLWQIEFGFKDGLDVSIYADPKFNRNQMVQIRWGLENGVDVSIYADPKFSHLQMEEIRWGLQNGVNVSLYADPKFNWMQMKQIRWGLEAGIDVSVYANPAYSEDQMGQIHQHLEIGFDVRQILSKNLSCKEMEKILKNQKPSVEQFMKNYNIINDGKKAIFYKAVRKRKDTMFFSNYDSNFIYKIGETAIEPNIDRDVNETCTEGIHVSSLVWAKQFANSWNDSSFIEVEVDVDDIVLPIDTDGKVRVSHAKVLREVF